MLFNSLGFFAFFAAVYLLYRILPFRWQNRLLIVAGYIFYGCWDVRFLFLIACSTTVDFCIGLLLANGRLPARQRYTASFFLIGAAILFLCPDWSALNIDKLGADIPALLNPQPIGLRVLVATVIFVLVTNLLISYLPTISEERGRRILVICSVLVNLSFLGFFKYFNFFIDSAADALRVINVDPTNFRLGMHCRLVSASTPFNH